MRIGLVKYLNALPFRHLSCDITFGTPRELNQMMRKGELDIAFASSVEYFLGNYDYLPGFCLAAKGPILSVNLYLKEKCPLDGASIYLDPASSTGNALFKLLAEHHWKASVHITEQKELSDGFVQIGDEALKHQEITGYVTHDLAAIWQEMTSLPFVFALFIKQKGIDTTAIEKELHFSLESFMSTFDESVEKIAKGWHLPRSLLTRYFKLCHYKLGTAELQGLQRFGELLDVQAIHA